MKTFDRTLAALSLACFLFGLTARADTLMNSFDTSFDYVANGIVGDTNWDGVYLRFGDIPNGSAGGSGGGNTLVANTASPFPAFLNLQSVGGDWSGGDNDGFFIYKVVRGDFDVSVQNVPGMLAGGVGFDSRGFNFAGLHVRTYNPDNSGAAYSTTTTNLAENSLRLWRFQEFGIDGQIRQSTNNANNEFNFPGSNDDTNSARGYRITRTGNIFSFYIRTNSFDPWTLITNANGIPAGTGTVTRDDWEGVALQVGIAQAPFSTASRDVIFDDFELSGTNVTFPALPTAPTSLVTTATNSGGSLTLSWTKGTPANNSLVVMSERPIQHNPIQGITYTASSTYGDPASRLGGAGEFVVFDGSGTSVTVTNLGANNRTYYAAVFEYSGSGDSTVYNTASPAVNSFAGPGVINSVELVAPTDDIPVDGAVALSLIASFSTGETSDQTASTTWSSDNTGAADVTTNGVVSGLASGSANISGTFGSFNVSTNISVHAPVSFTDSFAATHDYVADGLAGTPYNGLYLGFGDVPLSDAGGDGEGSTPTMNSQITDTNGLYVSSVQSTWSGNANDGPFLFKGVPGSDLGLSGDFSAVLHIEDMNTLNGVVAGLMARLYNPVDGGPVEGPGGEVHIEFWKVQDGATSVRRTQTQPGNDTSTIANGSDVGWLLMTRVDSTNFYFFERADTNSLWTLVASTVLEAAANDAPMQVGIAQQSTAGVNALTTFDYFSLDAEGTSSATTPPPAASDFNITLNESDLSMTLDWVAADAGGNPVASIAVMRNGGPVTAQPTIGADLVGDSVFGQGTDLGGNNYVVFVSDNPPASTNNSVTVTGLQPGDTYYASIFTFTGSGASKVFNTATPVTSSLPDGTLTGIIASLEGGIPLGGIGQLSVHAVYTGVAVPVTGAQITSGDTNIIKVFGGVLTGITNGMAPISAAFGGFTNVVNVTVRPPAFSDNFSTDHDYLFGGVAGTGWDDMYNPNAVTNPIPSSPYAPLDGSGAIVADANVTSNNVLTITAAGDGWENDASGGFFLFKYVPGNFQVAVHIDSFDVAAFNQPGLLARGYGADENGNLGTPLGTVVPNADGTNDLGEYWVSLTRFDEFGIGTYARRNIDSGVSQNTQPDQGDNNFWLLISRKGTEFDFFKRLNADDPWQPVPNMTHYSITQLAGQPMQVGIMAGPWNGTGGSTGVYRSVGFDNFMLDTTAGSTLEISSAGGNVTLSWAAIPGTLEDTPSLNPTDWQTVTGTPTLTTNGYSLTLPLGPDERYFRLSQ